MPDRRPPSRPPRHDVHRAIVLWSIAGAIGITVAVTLTVRSPFPARAPALGAIGAVLGGWLAMLLFAPWRQMAALNRDRNVIADLTRRLHRTVRGDGATSLRELIIDRNDEIGALSRAIHRALAETAAQRRENRLLHRTIDDKVRRETNRATVQLKRQAATDPLTGLGNRRELERRLEAFFSHDRRRRRDCVVAMVLDVDLFKTVNDTLGHEEGDRCLAFLGGILSSTLRGEDCAIRHGGDEFIVLMPNQSMEEAKAVARRLCALFAQMPWPHRRVARPTLSIGMAIAWSNDLGGGRQLLRRADAALYEAKAAGRNTIRAFEQPRQAA